MLEEAAVVIAPERVREGEARGAHGAPDDRGDQDHRQQAPQRAVRQEKLGQLSARAVTAGDHHRLEDESRKQVLLEPG